MKKLFAILAIAGVVTACNSSSDTSTSSDTTTTMDTTTMMAPMDTTTMSPMDTMSTDTTTVR